MKRIEAGEMFGFRIVNTFPDTCTEEEWTEFADNVSKILNGKEINDKDAKLRA